MRRSQNSTAAIAEELWLFTPIPEVQDTLLQGLLQEAVPADVRLTRFELQSQLLGRLLQHVHTVRGLKLNQQMLFWRNGIVPPVAPPANPPAAPSVDKNKAMPVAEQAAAEVRLARMILPRLLKLMEEDTPSAYWKEGKEPAWLMSGEFYADFGKRLLRALRPRMQDQAFVRKVEKLLDSAQGTPQQRLYAVSLLEEGVDEDTALFLASIAGRENGYDDCWGYSSAFSYGLDMNWRGDSEARLRGWLSGQMQIVTAEEKARQAGQKINIKERSGPPEPGDFTALSGLSGQGRFYLLLEHAAVLPELWRQRAMWTFSAGTPLQLLHRGPRLLVLDPAKAEDVAILRWYATSHAEGTGEGDKQERKPDDRSVLIWSAAPEKEIARRLTAWHLMLWEKKAGETSIIMARPYTGSFFLAVLPEMRGRAASLFLGPGEKIWFANPGLSGTKWYEASPEKNVKALPPSTKQPVLVFSLEQHNAGDKQYVADFLVRTSLEALRAHPRQGVDGQSLWDFMHKAYADTAALAEKNAWGASDRKRALLLLWRMSGTPQEEKGRELLLHSGTDGNGPDFKKVESFLRSGD